MNESQVYESIWETYVRSWKVATEEGKRPLLDASLSPDCLYRDPLARAEGRDELIAYALDFDAKFPGAHFVTQRFLAFDRHAAVGWEMHGVDGSALGDGMSYVEFGGDEKIVRMIAFFEAPA